jgi:hypothetical protein
MMKRCSSDLRMERSSSRTGLDHPNTLRRYLEQPHYAAFRSDAPSYPAPELTHAWALFCLCFAVLSQNAVRLDGQVLRSA